MARDLRRKRISPKRLANSLRTTATYALCQFTIGNSFALRDAKQFQVHSPLKLCNSRTGLNTLANVKVLILISFHISAVVCTTPHSCYFRFSTTEAATLKAVPWRMPLGNWTESDTSSHVFMSRVRTAPYFPWVYLSK